MNQLPISLSVWGHRLSQITEEMGAALRRSALSANIKERCDFSCAYCDDQGRLVAQAAHIPVHLGSTSLAVQAVLGRLLLGPADVAIVNDPFCGGTHLPDVTLVAPLYAAGGARPVGYLAVRAHHADVGGCVPGSSGVMGGPELADLPTVAELPPAVGPRYAAYGDAPAPVTPPVALTIDDEGICLAPTLLTEEVERRFVEASRSPAERRGDLRAQQGALRLGQERLQGLLGRYGEGELRRWSEELQAYAERITVATLQEIPEGVYAFADSLDDDGAGQRDIAIRVRIEVRGGQAVVDFSDSDDEVPGAVNAVWPVTVSAVLYAFRLLLPDETPTNEGCQRPLRIIAREGSVVNARPPRAVAAGNTETSQRIVDVVLGALSQALPGRVPAASCGSMNNLLLGNEHFVYYETLAGGAGGGPAGPGCAAIHTHMTNTLNTPVEALEHAAPLLVRRYAVRRGSGGGGVHPGGDGVVRELELLEDMTVTLVGERRRRPPYGLRGGGPGQTGRDLLTRDGEQRLLPAKITFAGRRGDRLTLETPGGGGWKAEISWDW